MDQYSEEEEEMKMRGRKRRRRPIKEHISWDTDDESGSSGSGSGSEEKRKRKRRKRPTEVGWDTEEEEEDVKQYAKKKDPHPGSVPLSVLDPIPSVNNDASPTKMLLRKRAMAMEKFKFYTMDMQRCLDEEKEMDKIRAEVRRRGVYYYRNTKGFRRNNYPKTRFGCVEKRAVTSFTFGLYTFFVGTAIPRLMFPASAIDTTSFGPPQPERSKLTGGSSCTTSRASRDTRSTASASLRPPTGSDSSIPGTPRPTTERSTLTGTCSGRRRSSSNTSGRRG